MKTKKRQNFYNKFFESLVKSIISLNQNENFDAFPCEALDSLADSFES